MSIPKRIFSWTDVDLATTFIKHKLEADNFKPDYVVGLTRGGLIPAVILSHMYGVKLVPLDASFRDSEDSPESNLWLPESVNFSNKKVLIVDDINDSGATFNWIKQDWNTSTAGIGGIDWSNVKFAALVHNKASTAPTDYTYLTINKAEQDIWIVYPWENKNESNS